MTKTRIAIVSACLLAAACASEPPPAPEVEPDRYLEVWVGQAIGLRPDGVDSVGVLDMTGYVSENGLYPEPRQVGECAGEGFGDGLSPGGTLLQSLQLEVGGVGAWALRAGPDSTAGYLELVKSDQEFSVRVEPETRFTLRYGEHELSASMPVVPKQTLLDGSPVNLLLPLDVTWQPRGEQTMIVAALIDGLSDIHTQTSIQSCWFNDTGAGQLPLASAEDESVKAQLRSRSDKLSYGLVFYYLRSAIIRVLEEDGTTTEVYLHASSYEIGYDYGQLFAE